MVDDFETSKLITRIDFGVFYEHFYDQTPKLCDIIEDKRRFLLLDEFVHAYGKNFGKDWRRYILFIMWLVSKHQSVILNRSIILEATSVTACSWAVNGFSDIYFSHIILFNETYDLAIGARRPLTFPETIKVFNLRNIAINGDKKPLISDGFSIMYSINRS